MKHLEASPHGHATNRVVISGWPSGVQHRHDIVSDATREHERAKDYRNIYTSKRHGRPGCWISGCWYPARAQGFVAIAKGLIIKETLLFPDGTQHCPGPPLWAVY